MLREMHWTDIPQVVALEQELFPADAWSAELFWAELAGVPESRDVRVLELDGRIVGYCSARFVGHDGDINTIAVAPDVQGQGHGKAMLEHMHTVFRAHKVDQVFLEVRADNEAALHLYQNAGYERIDIRKRYYDNEVDAIIMRAKLRGAA